MDVSNRQVAGRLTFMGQLLEIAGADPFKIRAYYRAARQVERLETPVSGMSRDELVRINGIGKNLAEKISGITGTGTFHELEELRDSIPSTLIELLAIEGVGPKTVHKLWKKLDVMSVEDLEKAAQEHRIQALQGFGRKKEDLILRSVAMHHRQSGRMTRIEAEEIIRAVLRVIPEGKATVAGSFRRGVSTIGDIDIVTTAPLPGLNPLLRGVADAMMSEGSRRTSCRIHGRRVDIRFAAPEYFGSMLLYLTGSKEFNIRLREVAISKGCRLNEYGIEERSGSGRRHTFKDEEEIFEFLGMEYIPPELREARGEIQHSLDHDLPVLVEAGDIRGDLHVHSTWSDGRDTLREIAKSGEEHGYEYILISDHSSSLGIAHGLDEKRIEMQMHEIEVINRESGCQVIAGIEVDIAADGSPTLPDKILADLDIVIASVHSGFRQEKDIMTRRIITAIENKHVDIIGHPTGRLLGRRLPYDLDMPRVIRAAAEHGTALEINAFPYRLDLDDNHIIQAREQGVPLSIGTDAHQRDDLHFIRYGVMLARRGWCTPGDLLNTRTLSSLLEWCT